MRIQLFHKFEDIISVENLLLAWREFIPGKRKKLDVQEFSFNLMDNIIQLHQDLTSKTYNHGGYYAFKINDPKPRNIHKASVRDRLVHHAIYRILYPFFDRTFISDSFSCRLNKGTHRALNRFRSFGYQVSKNHTRTVWVLKCDIRKFFASIDQNVLIEILKSYIPNQDIVWLLGNIIRSFSVKEGVGLPPHQKDPLERSIVNSLKAESVNPKVTGINSWRGGLPLGNLTSQLFCNIYMNEFDQFVKHQLKVRHYIRYADDFVVFSEDKSWLEDLVNGIGIFLKERLKLDLHPDKLFLKTLASGMDFLGWVHFPDHRILRTATRKRMMRSIRENPKNEVLQSYLGLLSHGDAQKLKNEILMKYL